MTKKLNDRFDEFKNFMRNRVKNRYLWAAVIALVANMGLSGFITLPDNFEGTATALLNVLMIMVSSIIHQQNLKNYLWM